MKTKIFTPALILLLLFLPGCGREENVAGNETDVSVETEGNDEVSAKIENTSAEDAFVETKEEESVSEETASRYPIIATPSSVKKIDFMLVSEGSYCIFDREKYGFLAEDGEEIAPCIYDIAYPFSEGLACVCRDGKYGYIDSRGETVIPFIYDRATPFVEGLAYFAIGDDYGFMDQTGTQIFSLECDSVSSFQEGLAYFSINGRYGYIDRNGQAAIEPVFDDAGYFQDGLATVMKDGRYGVINREGEIIVSTESYDSTITIIDEAFIITKSDGKYTCFDRMGEVLLEGYDGIYIAQNMDSAIEGNYLYFVKDGKRGLADEKGNVLFAPLYDNISLLPSENLLLIQEDELYGVADLQGEVIIPAIYDHISYDSYGDDTEGGMLVLRDADKILECRDITNLFEKIPGSYDNIEWISQHKAAVQLDGYWGIIDGEGNLIEPIEYEAIRFFEDGAVWMKRGSQSWFYSRRGKAVEDFGDYDNISKDGNCYKTEKNHKYGYLNELGEEVLPPIYESVESSAAYGANYTHMAWYNNVRDSIIKTGEPDWVYISGVLLQNEITPRIGHYQEFTRSGSISVDGNEYDLFSACTVTQEDLRAHKKKYKLFDLNHSGEPLLYFEANPYAPTDSTPYSYSGFYTALNNQLVEVVTVYEYSGYGQGDSACIWYDRETAQAFPGIRGFWGDIAENSGYGAVYDKKNGEITNIASFRCIVQSISRFSDEELAHAELIYDRDNKPYTKERIEQAENGEIAVIYFVNDEQTTIEAYQQMADRYQKISFVE